MEDYDGFIAGLAYFSIKYEKVDMWEIYQEMI